MFLVPVRFIFWGRLDLFFIFYFQKMRKIQINIEKILENLMEIKQKGKQIHFFVLWTAVGPYIILLHGQKKWKNFTKLPKKKIEAIVSPEFGTQNSADISQFSKPKYCFRYQWGQVSSHKMCFYKFVNMIHIFKKSLKWIVMCFLS